MYDLKRAIVGALCSTLPLLPACDDDSDTPPRRQPDGGTLVSDSGAPPAGFDPMVGGDVCVEGEFEPCGGDPVGSWTGVSSCVSAELFKLTVPCEQGTVDFEVGLDGGAVIDDESIELDLDAQSATSVNIPLSCLDAEICDEFFMSQVDGQNVTEVDGVCTVRTEVQEQRMLSEQITIEEGRLVDAEGDVLEFCVKGDLLVLRLALGGAGDYQLLRFERE